MATELENSIRSMAASVAKYVEDAATMTVETQYVHISLEANVDNFEQAKPIARTIVRLDGDSQSIIPMRQTKESGLEVDTSLFEIHQRNVNTAIEYRARILAALLGVLPVRK